MKSYIKIALKLTAILLVMAGSFSCQNKADNDDNVSYAICPHEGGYMDTTKVEGYAYLFNDSIPELINIELQKNWNTFDSTAWIIYNRNTNAAILYASSKKERSTGNICNYPEFARQWQIPLDGQQVYYKGINFKTGEYLSAPASVGYDVVLTILKKE